MFYSSPVRQTNKTQPKDECDTNGRRIDFAKKQAKVCGAGG
ncbi:hypothetical protein HMPREF1981_03385 [Bacteroides pyogenes F0041]|uniref:Uncharacterized protein n=1 Tax=Bacteroides pyogenes F0041 TaxID=1321819 RepID=U2C9G1_9BACE|nr:hypothetical protein HMPREF1981_03385 [Bacteroides pyogenes F0041]